MKITPDSLLKTFMEMRSETAYFLDSQTGEVLKVAPSPSPAELKAIKDKMAVPGRIIKMPRYPASQNYQDMECFIPTLNHIQLQKRLTDALKSGGNASKFFRDALMSHPKEKEKWNEFKAQRLKLFIKDFLKSNRLL